MRVVVGAGVGGVVATVVPGAEGGADATVEPGRVGVPVVVAVFVDGAVSVDGVVVTAGGGAVGGAGVMSGASEPLQAASIRPVSINNEAVRERTTAPRSSQGFRPAV